MTWGKNIIFRGSRVVGKKEILSVVRGILRNGTIGTEGTQTNHHAFTNSEECNDGFLKDYTSGPDAPDAPDGPDALDAPTPAMPDESAGGALSAPDHAGEPEDAPGYAKAHERTPDHAGAPEGISDHAGAPEAGALEIAQGHPALKATPFGPAVLPEDATPGSLIADWYEGRPYMGTPRPEFADGVTATPIPLRVSRKRQPTSKPPCAVLQRAQRSDGSVFSAGENPSFTNDLWGGWENPKGKPKNSPTNTGVLSAHK